MLRVYLEFDLKEISLSKAEFRVNPQKYWYETSLNFSGN